MIYIKDKTAIIPKNISGTVFTLEVTSPFGTTTIFNDSQAISDEGYYYIFPFNTNLEVGEYTYILTNEDGEFQKGLITFGDYTKTKVNSLNNNNDIVQWKKK